MSPTYSICKHHGYLSGEHFTCPECGEKAEVYSRITGYYRPVQNWNEGKSQEYVNRKLYNPGSSFHVTNRDVHKEEEEVSTKSCMIIESDENSSASNDGLYLFTTKTCPNCAMAKTYLEGVAFKVVDAEENMEITSELGIMQAPTLVEVKDGEIKKYVNASNIKRFAEENCLTV